MVFALDRGSMDTDGPGFVPLVLRHTPGSKHWYEQQIKHLRREYKSRFLVGRRREPLYGNLPRALSEEHAIAILRFARARSRPFFALMLLYGLREKEALDARIVPGMALVAISSGKTGKTEYLPLIEGSEILFTAPKTYYAALRRDFRDASDLAGTNFVYGLSTMNRRLYQYTTHSLRHTAISLVARHTHDPFLTSAFARHSRWRSFGTTGIYIHTDLEQVRRAVSEAILPLVIKALCV